jgi:hypothetical protein
LRFLDKIRRSRLTEQNLISSRALCLPLQQQQQPRILELQLGRILDLQLRILDQVGDNRRSEDESGCRFLSLIEAVEGGGGVAVLGFVLGIEENK